jgi:hypothetical protein
VAEESKEEIKESKEETRELKGEVDESKEEIESTCKEKIENLHIAGNSDKKGKDPDGIEKADKEANAKVRKETEVRNFLNILCVLVNTVPLNVSCRRYKITGS